MDQEGEPSPPTQKIKKGSIENSLVQILCSVKLFLET